MQRKRFEFDEKDTIRARDRIQQALSRLSTGLQTLDSKLLQHVNLVVERTVVDVGDTKAGVERTEKGVERTEKGIELIKAYAHLRLISPISKMNTRAGGGRVLANGLSRPRNSRAGSKEIVLLSCAQVCLVLARL
jgi:predicted transcriptional regulator